MDKAQDQGGLICEPRKVGYIWIVYLLLFAVAVPWYWPCLLYTSDAADE